MTAGQDGSTDLARPRVSRVVVLPESKVQDGGFAGLWLQGGDLRRRPQIRSSSSSGAAPGRWWFFVVSSSSSEVDTPAARQRLRARGSAAPLEVVLGGRFLRRLRRCRVRSSVDLEVEDGLRELRRPLFPLLSFVQLYLFELCSSFWLNTSMLISKKRGAASAMR